MPNTAKDVRVYLHGEAASISRRIAKKSGATINQTVNAMTNLVGRDAKLRKKVEEALRLL